MGVKQTYSLALVVLLSLCSSTAFSQNSTPKIRDIFECAYVRAQTLYSENVRETQITMSKLKTKKMPDLNLEVGAGTFIGDINSVVGSITLNQKLYSAALNSEINSTDEVLKSDKYEILQAALRGSFEIISQLAEFEKSHEEYNLIQSQVKNYSRLKSTLTVTHRAGVSDANDYLQINIAILELQSKLETIKNNLIMFKSDFFSKYGFSPRVFSDFSKIKLPVFNEVAKLPQIRAIESKMNSVEYMASALKRGHWPELSLQASYGNRTIDQSTSSKYDGTASVFLNLELSGLWKASAPGRDTYELKQTLSRQRDKLIVEFSSFFNNIVAEKKSIEMQSKAYESRVSLALKSRSVSAEKIKIGRLTYYEMLQVEQSYFRSEQEFISSKTRMQELDFINAISFFASKAELGMVPVCRL